MKTLILLKRSISIKLYFFFLLIPLIIGCHPSEKPALNIILNPLFSDNMVLQQKQDITIWGNAEPGGKIYVELANQNATAIVDTSGNWSVSMNPFTAGGPFELTVRGKDTLKIKNVMIGEVWLCSGQSNMEMPLAGWGKINNYEEEIAQADYPNIRLLKIEKTISVTPNNNFNSKGWEECSPETIGEFSSVAYFFGRHLQNDLNVPIGLIESAWGGTVIEAWTSGKSLKKLPEFADVVREMESDSTSELEKNAAEEQKINEWSDKIEQTLKFNGTFDHGFQSLEYKTDKWKTMKLPSHWEDSGLDLDGVVWFDKSVNVPKLWEGENLILSLGKINDYDITWFNGLRIGRGTDASDSRIYKIPGSIVKKGENKITVMVLDIGNVGGLYGPAKQMKLSLINDSISLVGSWRYKTDPIQIDVNKLPSKSNRKSGPNYPTVLYNGMINPIVPFGIKGAIWYQGESNAERAYQYRTLFKTLINDWRDAWREADLPFLFVQLANFKNHQSQTTEDSWAELREAQVMTLELPNTGMAVSIDIGDALDIHPKTNKKLADD